MAVKRIGILTGGGDCPGLNPTIKGVVTRCADYGIEVLGLQNGWKSLVGDEPDAKPLTLEDVRPIIIFQTDGDQLFSIKSATSLDQNFSPNQTAFTDKQLMDSIERSRATIYSVISGYSLLGLSQEEQKQKAQIIIEKTFDKKDKRSPEDIASFTSSLFRQQTSMSVIAKLSGGFHEKLETPEQADKVYENILNGITNRYLIGYYPTNQERNGKRRTIKITIKNHPEYVVWGRKSYYTIPLKK